MARKNKSMILVYITCESNEQAKKIGTHLLKKRLCACVNIFEHMTPIYWWSPKKGKLSEDREVVLIVKTVKEKFKAIEKEVTKIHSYSVPCIFSIKVDQVNKPYLEWLTGEIEE